MCESGRPVERNFSNCAASSFLNSRRARGEKKYFSPAAVGLFEKFPSLSTRVGISECESTLFPTTVTR